MTGILSWRDLAIGKELDVMVDQPLTVTNFVRYQGASGDMNPIHHDTEFAKKAGYPGPFAVGMLQAGVMATYVTDRFGTEAVRRFKVQFRELAWPGDVITYRGAVVALREADGERLADLELAATCSNGEVHLWAWATVVVRLDRQQIDPGRPPVMVRLPGQPGWQWQPDTRSPFGEALNSNWVK